MGRLPTGHLGQCKTGTSESHRNAKGASRQKIPQRLFQIGEKVYLSIKYLKLRLPCKKLCPKLIEPFPIIKIINLVTGDLKFPCQLGKIHLVFHRSFLKPVIGSGLRPVAWVAPDPNVVQRETHYKVKRILDSRLCKGRLQYSVQGKGYPLSEATWMKNQNKRADRLVRKCHDKNPHKPKEQPSDGRGG